MVSTIVTDGNITFIVHVVVTADDVDSSISEV